MYRELFIVGVYVLINVVMLTDAWGYIGKGRNDEKDDYIGTNAYKYTDPS